MVVKLDLADQLNDYINGLSPFAPCEVGALDIDSSLAIMLMPGGPETVFMDGSRMKSVQMQIMAKDNNYGVAPEFLSELFQLLELLESLPSENGSYDFYGVDITSLPAVVAIDTEGFAIYQCSIAINILIHKGVA